MFQILTICSANVCRSPLAAAALASRDVIRRGDRIQVSSAGLWAAEGPAMCAVAARWAGLQQDDAAGHQARPVTRGMISQSGLILVAERRHRAAIATAIPDAAVRTFTFREAAALCVVAGQVGSGADAERQDAGALGDLVRRMNAARGTVAYPDSLVVPRRGLRRVQKINALDIPDSHEPPLVNHNLVMPEVLASIAAVTRAIERVLERV